MGVEQGRTGSAIDETSNARILIKSRQKVTSSRIIANLSKLERNSTATVARTRNLLNGITDAVRHSVVRFASRLTISNRDDEHRFVQTAGACGADNHGFENLVPQAGSQRSQTLETDARGKHGNIICVADTVAGFHVVHEAHRDAILVESGGCRGDDADDLLELFLAHTFLFELDGATVVDIEDHIEQSQLHDIRRNLHGNSPFMNQVAEFNRRFNGEALDKLV